MQRGLVSLFSIICLWLLNGCAQYQFRIVQPTTAAQPIEKKTITLVYEPLEYRFAIYNDEHFVMRIVNPTDDAVTIVSARSYLIDPAGETHPMLGRTIAPHSYVGMYLPPLPRVLPGPYYYGGWGAGFGYYPYWGHWHGPPFYPSFYYDPWFYGPAYSYRVVTPYDWDWKQGIVRMKIEYDLAGKTFTHEFVFERRKIK